MRKFFNIFKLPNIFLTISVVSFIVWLLFRGYYYQTFPKAKIDALFEPVTSKYGIKIVYKIGNDFFSPLKNPLIPAGPPRCSKIKPIRDHVLIRYPDILLKAFSKYPDKVIKKYLKAIYFAGDIDDGDIEYSGTYDPFRRIVYLVDDGGKDDREAMDTFHHEFSSLLLTRHSFFINPWADHNPKGFIYLTERYKRWKTLAKEVDLSKKGSAKDYEKGFMRVYGETDFENDFNEYSAMIFTYPKKFKKIMNRYPRVRGKFLVWLKFYQRIDPIFTEKYLLGGR
jgi:hypothetical protein